MTTTTAPCLTRALRCAAACDRVSNVDALPDLLAAVGRLVACGTPAEVLAAREILAQAYWRTQQ